MVQQMFGTTITEAIEILQKSFKNFEQADNSDENRFVSILISRPGVGKSATIAKMAEDMGYYLIDLNLACIEPTDIIGLGAREKIDGVWTTMSALPQWAETALAGKCIIFVDEFNNTTQDVLAGFQKMFSDFVIDGKKLPRTTHIIGACNPPGTDALYAAKRLSGAFRRRLCMIPIIDDFDYVMKKHKFDMPFDFVNNDYEDIMEYCAYNEISSAVVDNIFNINNYDNLTELEKATLINGFGEKALKFAKSMSMFSDDVFTHARRNSNYNKIDITYGEWKRNPQDIISEYQQILWGQESIQNSKSYSRSKKFVSRIENARVYEAIYEILKTKFEIEYEIDETKLPETNT